MESKMEPFLEKSDFQEFAPRLGESLAFDGLRAPFWLLLRCLLVTLFLNPKKTGKKR